MNQNFTDLYVVRLGEEEELDLFQKVLRECELDKQSVKYFKNMLKKTEVQTQKKKQKKADVIYF